jgi:NADH:ubiquinone oxidoreductase subunit F (NADH-binding)
MNHLTARIASDHGTPADVQLLQAVASQIKNKCLCALGEFSIEAVLSGLERFKEDFNLP